MRPVHPRGRAPRHPNGPPAALVGVDVLDRMICLVAEARAIVDLVLADELPPIADDDAARRLNALRVASRLLAQAAHGATGPRP